MCHLILSTCKIFFFSLILTLQTGWISVTTVYFRLLVHAVANPSCILHSLLMCQCMLCVPLPLPVFISLPRQHLWTFSTMSLSGTSLLSWSARLLLFPIKSFSKGCRCPDTCRNYFSSCAKAVLYFLTFFLPLNTALHNSYLKKKMLLGHS